MSLSNNPIYFIDGIRVEGTTGSSTLSVGGSTPSRVGDLNPEKIENIEIVRGPSAATLYGTDAANGVIVITTKRGVAGRPQWTYYTNQSLASDRNDYPTAYTGWRTGTVAQTTAQPLRSRLRRPDHARASPAPRGRGRVDLSRRGQPAGHAGSGRDRHAAGHRARADRCAGPARHPRGRGGHRRPARRPAPRRAPARHAGRGQAPPPAHRRAGQPGRHGPGPRHQRQRGAHLAAARLAGVRDPVRPIVTAMLDWAAARGIGFSRLVSLGDTIDVDLGDLLDYLADDPATRAILMYMESATGARKFMSAARAAARSKPVIVVKAGRSAEGARAAALHTAVTGADAVYDAVFRRAGMLRVHSLAELFEAAEILTLPALPRGDRLAILTNGGGIGVMATDALVTQGGRLAPLSPATMTALDQVLPSMWSRSDVVDVGGDAPGARYGAAPRALLGTAGEEIDAVLILHCPLA